MPSSSVSMWYTWNSFHTLSRSVCEGRSSARSGVGIQVPPRDTQLAPWMERRGAYLREVGHFLHDLELLGRQAPLERAAALPAAAAAMRRERSAKSRGACEARQRAREARSPERRSVWMWAMRRCCGMAEQRNRTISSRRSTRQAGHARSWCPPSPPAAGACHGLGAPCTAAQRLGQAAFTGAASS